MSAGLRNLIARRLGLRVGLDLAMEPEDTVVYIGIGIPGVDHMIKEGNVQ